MEYFKGFDNFIPTWIICICMMFWKTGWGCAVGAVLLIIQYMQLRKIKNEFDSTIEAYKIKSEINSQPAMVSSEPKIELVENSNKDIENDGAILTSGKYIGGRDISIGIYDVVVVSGYGGFSTDKPNVWKVFSKTGDYNSYKNLEIEEKTELRVDSELKIRLYNKRMFSTGELDKKLASDLDNQIEKENIHEQLDFDYDSMDGWEFEEFCARLLERIGYNDITVTSGSGDFGADVIAYKDTNKYVIQCKNYSGKVGNKAVQEVFSAKAYYSADIAVVMTNNYFTEHAIEHAKGTDVVLWNRDTLNSMIEKARFSSGDELEDIEEKKQNEVQEILYDKEKGIFPSGRYIVGEDIQIGSYILISRKDDDGEVNVYKSPDGKDKIIDEYFTGAFYLSLKEEGNLLVVKDAHIQSF